MNCLFCNSSLVQEVHSFSTSTYYPPIYENGVNINPDRNIITTTYRCATCDQTFQTKGNATNGFEVIK